MTQDYPKMVQERHHYRIALIGAWGLMYVFFADERLNASSLAAWDIVILNIISAGIVWQLWRNINDWRAMFGPNARLPEEPKSESKPTLAEVLHIGYANLKNLKRHW